MYVYIYICKTVAEIKEVSERREKCPSRSFFTSRTRLGHSPRNISIYNLYIRVGRGRELITNVGRGCKEESIEHVVLINSDEINKMKNRLHVEK